MLLKYIYDERLAQASYLLGCADAGEALVVDPMRDITPYLELAEANGLKIIHVVETHIHADYISGGYELAKQTGATLHVSGLGEGDLAYNLEDKSDITINYLKDNERIQIGGVRVEAFFTPGHTPEHMSYLVYDTGAGDPIGVFSGDCVFVGDVGRPDLLDAAGLMVDSKEDGARQQFHSIQRMKALPLYLQVWPGHGAGSACGKALGAVPSTTIGYEKLYNPAFLHHNEDAFVDWLLSGQPEAPRYFAQMKTVNRVGAESTQNLATPQRLDDSALSEIAQSALVIDTRNSEDFAEKHVKGTLNIPFSSNSFSTWAGWYVDYTQPVYLIADEAQLPAIMTALQAIGVDNIGGYFALSAVETGTIQTPQIEPQSAHERDDIMILDVRGQNERDEEYIADSMFIPMGDVPSHIAQIPQDKPIVVQCGGGVRSQVVASILEKHDFEVINLLGGISAWKNAGLPLNNN